MCNVFHYCLWAVDLNGMKGERKAHNRKTAPLPLPWYCGDGHAVCEVLNALLPTNSVSRRIFKWRRIQVHAWSRPHSTRSCCPFHEVSVPCSLDNRNVTSARAEKVGRTARNVGQTGQGRQKVELIPGRLT